MVYHFFHLLCFTTFILAFPTCDSVLHRKLANSILWFFLAVYMTVHPYIRPHGKTWLPLDGLSWNFIFKYFKKKLCPQNSSFMKIFQNNEHFTWRPKYILTTSRSFLRKTGNVSDKSCRENQNTHFMFNNFLSHIVPFMR